MDELFVFLLPVRLFFSLLLFNFFSLSLFLFTSFFCYSLACISSFDAKDFTFFENLCSCLSNQFVHRKRQDGGSASTSYLQEQSIHSHIRKYSFIFFLLAFFFSFCWCHLSCLSFFNKRFAFTWLQVNEFLLQLIQGQHSLFNKSTNDRFQTN